ncbi:MAG: ATP-binding cassette domain-containing protein [Cardiobacteriaceae bacterium]|nr:ATP-binding cassette domain-containing protein [Cardiobacteriaceae bacterium]
MSIEIHRLHKKYGNFTALHPTDLRIENGEMATLLGPSGSGKTTLLRLIAGLESADGGRIMLNESDVTDVPVRKRHIGFVFQHYALFKHLNVIDNIAFGLTVLPRKQRPAQSVIQQKTADLLEMVQLSDLGKRYPSQLSGGQQQRVALARALAIEPEVVLFDEPFGALDVQVRQDLRLWLKNLQRELGFTGVFVTHDREEALDLADRIVVMRHGTVAQYTDPQNLYHAPIDAQVFVFMSDTYRFKAHVDRQILHCGRAWAQAEFPLADGVGELALRVQDIELEDHPPGNVQLPLVIENITLLGSNYRLTVRSQSWGSDVPWYIPLPAQVFLRHPLHNGQRVYIKPRCLYFLRDNGVVDPLFREEI